MQDFSIVAAIASNNIIGKNNKLPWHIPEEMNSFYKLIHGKPVIMGRKTFESIGKPIKNSRNIILSHNKSLAPVGYEVFNSIASILDLYSNRIEIMVIGGGAVYSQFLPFANRMYLTLIEHEFDGDVYFPKWSQNEWETVEEKRYKSNLCSYRFLTLLRKVQ